jgi:hypothetical protein
MSVLLVPELDAELWPTLGPQVCDFVEAYLVHGPGDLRGMPATIDAEKRALIYRAYEVYPPGHPQAGYRRFDRVVFSQLKGSAKTELAVWLAIAELDVEGPVRCDGFDAHRNPVGRSVTNPYIPMMAFTEQQSEDLAFGAMLVILEHSKIINRYDLGLKRIMRIKGDGVAKPMATAPSSRDGALTTFQHFDEPLALDTPVPTPRGWTTMGDLVTGDAVFGSDGAPCTVRGLSPIHIDRPCYRVTFGDGTSIVADAAHRWSVFDHDDSYRSTRIVTTLDLYNARFARAVRFTVPPRGLAVATVHDVDSVPVRCISVDSTDHLFLAGPGMVATHNTHRLASTRLKDAHSTMLANIPKRQKADAWTLETTTAFAPGEGSVAEGAHEYARDIADGRRQGARLFYFHRQAGDEHDLSTPDGRRAAFMEAAGPIADRYNVEKVLSQWDGPDANIGYLERVWLNRPSRNASSAFDVNAWRSRTRRGYVVPDGAWITLGFDGSRRRDATALIGTEVATGFQWPLVIIERPPNAPPEWVMPAQPFHQAIADAMRRWNVWRMYADPPYWETVVDEWAGLYGAERVVVWYTNQWKRMAFAVRAYCNAMQDEPVRGEADEVEAEATAAAAAEPVTDQDGGEAPTVPEIMHHDLTHDGNDLFTRHIANSRRRYLAMFDENREKLWIIEKEDKSSHKKMDAAVAGVLSWAARRDARKSGIGNAPEQEWSGNVMALA